MALPVWSDQQVFDQLVTGTRWNGGTITYGFPITTTNMTGSTELASFSLLNLAQRDIAKLTLQLWGHLISALIIQSNGSADIEFGLTSNGVSYASTYYPRGGTVWFNKNETSLTSPIIEQHIFISYTLEIGYALGIETRQVSGS